MRTLMLRSSHRPLYPLRALALACAAIVFTGCAKNVSFGDLEEATETQFLSPVSEPTPAPEPITYGFQCQITDLRAYFTDGGCHLDKVEAILSGGGDASDAWNHLKKCGMRLPENFDSLNASTQLFGIDELNLADGDSSRPFPGIDEKAFPQKEWYGVRCVAELQAIEGGSYFFALTSDDGSRLFVNGRKVIESNAIQAPTTTFGTVSLKKEPNTRLSVEYFQGPRFRTALQLWISNGPISATGSKPRFPEDYRLVSGSMLVKRPLP